MASRRFEDAGTSSRLHPLEHPKFGELLTCPRLGDTVHISEMFRLVRGTGHILDVLSTCGVPLPQCDGGAVHLPKSAVAGWAERGLLRGASPCRRPIRWAFR
ncbi:hypothetical protein SVIO_047660 [Streptomyces violaceusniger]|uniref:Uncharacterized protein n=1 Tax=Streptomyces violaceusniger TaxID=68280 RepID=A0A4D4L7Y7_STRVO|nr:hypothetical protein SVIO_047660 [Streptomyces violaceusniger]